MDGQDTLVSAQDMRPAVDLGESGLLTSPSILSVSAIAVSSPLAPNSEQTKSAPPLAAKSKPSYSKPSYPMPNIAPQKGSQDIVYGALDLGTNNCRLLVARPSRRGFFVIDAFSRIIKLGEGVSHTGVLSDDAIDRTLDALKICAAKMARRGVTRSRLVATQACRIAANGADFVARAKRETGLDLEIIGRETEARLAVSGCASLIDRRSDQALIFDIGGGSSEFVWLNMMDRKRGRRISIEDRLRMQDCIEAWTSLPFGVVTLAERFNTKNASAAEFDRMVSFIQRHIDAFSSTHNISENIARGHTHLLGTSGTVTTIAGVYLGLTEYTRAKVDGCWLSTESIRAISRRILSMTYEQRMAEPCIGPERADLILAGCAILEAMLRVWAIKSLRVADRGLREGILATLIAEDAQTNLELRRAKKLHTASEPQYS